jgi:hypothetical protein
MFIVKWSNLASAPENAPYVLYAEDGPGLERWYMGSFYQVGFRMRVFARGGVEVTDH